MFNDYLALHTAYPGLSNFSPWVAVVLFLVSFYFVLGSFLYYGLFRKLVEMPTKLIALVMMSGLVFSVIGLVIVSASDTCQRMAVDRLEKDLEAKVLAGKCITLKDRGAAYAVTGVNSVNHQVTLSPTAAGACISGKQGAVVRSTYELELVKLMTKQVLGSSKPFEPTIAAGIHE